MQSVILHISRHAKATANTGSAPPSTVCKMAVACVGVPQTSASHQQAAAHEQQQSFTPESQAPAYVVDVCAEEPATAEDASTVEVDAASATIDSTAAEQSSQQQQVTSVFELGADQVCFPCIGLCCYCTE